VTAAYSSAFSAVRALAAVERVVQRLAVMAGGGLLRALQGVGRGGDLSGGKPIGARGAGGIDRTLCLVHVLLGRLGAAGRKDGKDERLEKRNWASHTTHVRRGYGSETRPEAS